MNHARAPRVRDYRATDRDACLAVFDSNVPGSFLAFERASFAAFLDRDDRGYLVVEDGAGAIVACGGYAVANGTTTADLCWGMVLQECQRSGLGRILVEQRLARIAADPRITRVAMNTSQDTRAFYEKLGFTTTHVIPDGIAPDVDKCEMVLERLP
jgi:ribosomal protein S18 acetylase RimI-like enzyme